MRLRELIRDIEVRSVSGGEDTEVAGLHYDSRNIDKDWAFAAITGEKVDGNKFVPAAIDRGAAAILSERERPADINKGVAWVEVAHDRRALATAAANWFGRPSRALRLVGITGTNGKTTTAFLTESILQHAGIRTGLVGTVEYHVAETVLPSPHTTPESYDLQELFKRMQEARCSAAVMEVSSHALAMDRVWQCYFEAAAFTNLTQDHLDFHRTFDAYRAAKRRLFEGTGVGAPANAVVNADDSSSDEMVRGFKARVIRYGFSPTADLQASSLVNTPSGLRFVLRCRKDFGGSQRDGWTEEIQSPLLGRVNALNLLTAIGIGLSLGISRDVVLEGAQRVRRVHGRFERVYEGQPFMVVVDYAHTDDALKNVLALARELTSGSNGKAAGRVIALFGCGGDRDRGKRPKMGEAAGRASDVVVLTSDNPRSEDPMAIIRDALPGLERTPAQRIIEPDRHIAVERAIKEARPGDIVVLAGKGHETYQVIGNENVPFDDSEEARRALHALGYGKKS